MRFILKIFFFIILILTNVIAQQFYGSEGLALFNQGEYRASINSLISWADRYTAERGIAYYYIGECYYNLGVDATSVSQAVSYFKDADRYFALASNQTDLSTLYQSVLNENRYKKAWCNYRLAELENNPSTFLENAVSDFSMVISSSSDSISVYALYMIGESHWRLGQWKRIQMSLSPNVGQATRLAQEAVLHFDEAEAVFEQVINSNVPLKHLSYCAAIRYQDVLFERGKFYQILSPQLFSELRDQKKSNSTEETAVQLFNQVNYRNVLRSMDRLTQVLFEPLITYSMAVKYLNLYLLTGDAQQEQFLNSVLDSAQWIGFQEEKVFLQANRDQRKDIEDEVFIRLANDRISYYADAANTYFEAWYWLGWVQFIDNIEESGDQFSRL